MNVFGAIDNAKAPGLFLKIEPAGRKVPHVPWCHSTADVHIWAY